MSSQRPKRDVKSSSKLLFGMGFDTFATSTPRPPKLSISSKPRSQSELEPVPRPPTKRPRSSDCHVCGVELSRGAQKHYDSHSQADLLECVPVPLTLDAPQFFAGALVWSVRRALTKPKKGESFKKSVTIPMPHSYAHIIFVRPSAKWRFFHSTSQLVGVVGDLDELVDLQAQAFEAKWYQRSCTYSITEVARPLVVKLHYRRTGDVDFPFVSLRFGLHCESTHELGNDGVAIPVQPSETHDVDAPARNIMVSESSSAPPFSPLPPPLPPPLVAPPAPLPEHALPRHARNVTGPQHQRPLVSFDEAELEMIEVNSEDD